MSRRTYAAILLTVFLATPTYASVWNRDASLMGPIERIVQRIARQIAHITDQISIPKP